ncbi:TRAP transporter small permease subunit [Marinobacter sp. M3C]|jgi:TRAP-type mannitol/chloroaromatic compound transport system permease small subunit|uniref:TRAP transporter small permease subunit n=1 Tax=unclassified Marinobacter TaxID=83889 RepID=UPI0020106B70|nr:MULTISPECIES: TRAP transporter small permease subunit [unclassified Marinobacter]MCL1484871.1 TRAP transporter small permease subunit [Marinobacter sp.]UQG56471.1 TRAP transporter small permease subunit [Marinobacter sp. M4C]UQG62335.1 TRAP transporter small permease subunit [Marinobacter sp. M3C]UQG65275.1 TRAP transporter small permease subunit [Marinobacter sp. M2C]UQG69554.1 TRAP transporter small permease subunit [Marinobacter sp. M1C]
MSDLEGFGFVMPHWLYWGWLAVMPLIMIALDRPRRANPKLDTKTDIPVGGELQEEPSALAYRPSDENLFTRSVDWMSDKTGLFISFWTVNAVCFYFFEVIMRYVFNMPTIWVHEASFLLLGMQYLLAGGFALLNGSHVRVDVVYNYLPVRGRVGMDIFTSMFFFMFALVLILTSWTYFTNAYSMGETTVETWGIQYWPVKGVMLLGSVLILLAGISKLLKDISVFIRLGREASE